MFEKPIHKRYLIILTSTAISVLLFFLLLTQKIPYSFSIFFYQYSIPLFIILLGIYYFSFRLKGWWSWGVGLSVSLASYALPLSYLWTSGFSVRNLIGGVLPTVDGFHIYNSTQLLFSGQMLPSWSYFRPPSIGFLSSILLATNNNLQWAVAVIIAITGVCIYYSGRRIFNFMGALPAAVFIALMNFFMLESVGDPMSEWLGISIGCLGFILLWKAAESLKIIDLILGLVVLTVSVSVRAGAFFVFPILVIWSGWFFKREKKFSFRTAGIATLAILITFVLVNVVFPGQVCEPGSSSFGNFAFVVYSQVMGGTPWTKVRLDLGYGYLPPETIYRAALSEFLEHPHSLIIAVVKTYRDFFFTPKLGIFAGTYNSGDTNWVKWLHFGVWGTQLGLLLWGFVKVIRDRKSPFSMLLASVLIGIFISIPFVPPLFGGNRYYASTMPFFFAVLVFSFKDVFSVRKEDDHLVNKALAGTSATISALLIMMTFVVSVLILKNSSNPVADIHECPKGEVPFAVRFFPGTYVDIIPEGTSDCGIAPNVCFEDYAAHTRLDNVDEFFTEVFSIVEGADTSTRILLANNLIARVDDSYRFFIGPAEQIIPEEGSNMISGCAQKTESKWLLIVTSIEE